MTEDTKTLRDEFAMAAMASMLSCENYDAKPSALAAAVYYLADAMLAQRAKSSPALNEGDR